MVKSESVLDGRLLLDPDNAGLPEPAHLRDILPPCGSPCMKMRIVTERETPFRSLTVGETPFRSVGVASLHAQRAITRMSAHVSPTGARTASPRAGHRFEPDSFNPRGPYPSPPLSSLSFHSSAPSASSAWRRRLKCRKTPRSASCSISSHVANAQPMASESCSVTSSSHTSRWKW